VLLVAACGRARVEPWPSPRLASVERVAPPEEAAAARTEESPNPALLVDCEVPRSIVVRKSERSLELRCGPALAARYPVSLGFAPEGPKAREGDGRTPEGTYFISLKFPSGFRRSLQLAYPNEADADAGLADGRITNKQHAAIVRANRACATPPQNTPLGSFLQVHGGGGGPEVGDWTLGCVALDDAAIERVYEFHQLGCDDTGAPRTPVHILP
jgi:murein L,D-transpeptidase YafK